MAAASGCPGAKKGTLVLACILLEPLTIHAIRGLWSVFFSPMLRRPNLPKILSMRYDEVIVVYELGKQAGSACLCDSRHMFGSTQHLCDMAVLCFGHRGATRIDNSSH